MAAGRMQLVARGVPRSYKGKKALRRTMRRGMIRKIQNQIHHFKRTALIEDIVSINAAGLNKAYSFTLNQLPNAAEFVALYDSYKIKSITIRVEPAFSVNQMTANQVLSAKFVRVVHDYDDASALGTEQDYYEYGNMKSYSCLKPFKVILYPKVSAEIYRTALTTGYEQRKSPWLDLSSQGADIPHYGIKMFFPYLGIDNAFQFRVIATYHIECRQSK